MHALQRGRKVDSVIGLLCERDVIGVEVRMKSDTKPGRAFNAMLRSLVVTLKTVKSPPVFQENSLIQSLL